MDFMEVEPSRVSPSYIKGCYDDDKKKYEVHFPIDFKQDHPWQHPPMKWQDEYYPSQNVEKLTQNIKVPIRTLVHITHNAEAREIKKHMKFQAKQKFGKGEVFDGRPIGETYRFDGQGKKLNDIQPGEQVYVHIPDTDPVFPGFYSWWGIDCSAIPESATIAAVLTDLKEEDHISAYVPDYLKEYPESRYGNHAFSCNFRDLLRSYAESRRSAVVNICIRKGGTLRYRKEICYVLIVCIDCDEALLKYEAMQQQKQFQGKFAGLTNKDGKITNESTTPKFLPEYNITWVNGDHYSYELVSFAFYFPNEEGGIVIDRALCSRKVIEHKKEICMKKQPPPEGGKWKCPNDIRT